MGGRGGGGRGRGGDGGGRGRDGGGRGRDGGGRGRDGGGRGRGGGGGGGGKGDDKNITDAEFKAKFDDIVRGTRLINLTNQPKPQDPHQSASLPLAQRPGQGTKGQKVNILTNFYGVKPPSGHLFHYHVEVLPMHYNKDEGAAFVVNRADLKRPVPSHTMIECVGEVIKQQKMGSNPWAYDGRANIYAGAQLYKGQQASKGEAVHFQISFPVPGKPNPRRFDVAMTQVAIIDMAGLTAYAKGASREWPAVQLQAMEVIMNHTFLMSANQLYITRTFFKADQKGYSVGSGGEAWIGFKQDLRPCQFGLGLSIEATFSVFYEGRSVIDYIGEVLKRGRDPYQWGNTMPPADVKAASKEIRGLTVLGNYGKGETGFRATGISRAGAKDYKFEMTDKEGNTTNTTVAKYFESKGIKLKYPGLQCIEGRGRKDSTIAVPMELLSIKRGQKRKGLLIGDQQRNLVSHAAQKPNDKIRDISNWAGAAQTEWASVIGKFGMSIENTMKQVPGRVLPPPTIQYGVPANYFAGTVGAWNMENFKMLAPVTIKSWGVVTLIGGDRTFEAQGGPGSLANWLGILSKCFRSMGMTIPATAPKVHWGKDCGRNPDFEAVNTHIADALYYGWGLEDPANKPKVMPDLLFIILPRRDVQIYRHVKGAMDSMYGVVSQCIVASKASGLGRMGDATSERNILQYQANVGLKVNHKLGGRNMKIKGLGLMAATNPQGQPVAPPIWNNRPTMLIGIDVAHPQSFDKRDPSIAGIVASMDSSFGQYACRILQTGHRKEVVEDMTATIRELLLLFQARNRIKPEAIVVYRDGVSMGEFQNVLVKEYNAVRDACKSLGDANAGYCPPITYVTVLKRHKARLFPADQAANDGKGNVKPGTCVDAGITLAQGYDFYLVSHAGIQGTVKPAHYNVLLDENNFGPDALQIATHWLCYTFCRCTRSVSYCPPAYYAHHAADRGRVLLARDLAMDDSTSVSSEASETLIASFDVHADIKDKMFFV